MAFENFFARATLSAECIVVYACIEVDENEGRNIETTAGRIENSRILANDAVGFEFLDVFTDGGHRCSETLGDVTQAQTGVLLQQRTYISVELFHACSLRL
jgi:hypothetical protein